MPVLVQLDLIHLRSASWLYLLWLDGVFGPACQPIGHLRYPLGMLVASGQKANAVLRHRVLVGGLVAQVNALAHVIRTVGGGHVYQRVIEEQRTAYVHGHYQRALGLEVF